MGRKDITQKNFEEYSDVFSDIVNGCIYKGKQIVKPCELRAANVHSQYKADDGGIHEQERDVVKDWQPSNVRIAICGIENQVLPEKYMPLRVIGYEGASYRSQLLKDGKLPAPVLTIVLYWGTERRWSYPRNLKDILRIPEGMDEYINDFKINVFEVAWFTDEEISRFKSDFRIVANFFVQKRKNKEYVPDDHTEIVHVDALLKLLSVMTHDNRYEEILLDPYRKEIRNMCDVAERLENKGRAEGRVEGRVEGERNLATLITRLISLGRISDVEKAASDEAARKAFYKEFGIID